MVETTTINKKHNIYGLEIFATRVLNGHIEVAITTTISLQENIFYLVIIKVVL